MSKLKWPEASIMYKKYFNMQQQLQVQLTAIDTVCNTYSFFIRNSYKSTIDCQYAELFNASVDKWLNEAAFYNSSFLTFRTRLKSAISVAGLNAGIWKKRIGIVSED